MMKRKALGGILLLMLIVGMLSGCKVETKQSDIIWTIVESPITGRCYEVAQTYPSSFAMSEVTQAEYDAYISGLQK